MSEVAKWYQGKNVFVTGGTGFVGKSLVEKLLRDCPEIGYIYLMIRPKKGVSFDQRKLDYTKHVVFSCLKENQSHVFDKLRFIEGNLCAPDLGISDVDKKLVAETVSVIFHSAADVRFDQPLIDAYNSNVKGTDGLLKFAAQFKHIDVSRLFSNIKTEVPINRCGRFFFSVIIIGVCSRLDGIFTTKRYRKIRGKALSIDH